jgi:hypothetical protein
MSLISDHTAIVPGFVRPNQLLYRRENAALAERWRAHVSYELIVIVKHVEDQSSAQLLTGRHPPPLPVTERLDFMMHQITVRQSDSPSQNVAEPSCLEAVREDIGDGRSVANESEPRHVWMQDVSIEVEPVPLNSEAGTNRVRKKRVFYSPPGSENDEVSSNFLSGLKDNFGRRELTHAKPSGLHHPCPHKAIKLRPGQHSGFTEAADFDRLIR